MARSRSFSIFLLKEGFTADNALKENHGLDSLVSAGRLPPRARLYILDSMPRPPWWRAYFDVDKELSQVNKGALLFLPVDDEVFALSFGRVQHNLRDEAYEYDFGLRVTLNCIDPKKIRNADTVEPGPARRRRTQSPMDSDLTFFDIDRDTAVLRSLTGKAKDEYKDLISQATGASSLRIGSKAAPEGLVELCRKLSALYKANSYRASFPNIENLMPARDPAVIEWLNDQLVTAVREQPDNLYLTVPELVDYRESLCISFRGAGSSPIYDEVSLDHYVEYLAQNGFSFTTMKLDDLKRHRLQVTNEDGLPLHDYAIYKSLVFDVCGQDEKAAYHLNEGQWYRVAHGYFAELEQFLDGYQIDLELPEFTDAREDAYNDRIARGSSGTLMCLDKTDIGPAGQTQVEPCDLLRLDGDHLTLIHVKISTLSHQLSHLFNQGTNVVELLKGEEAARAKLATLVVERSSTLNRQDILAALDAGNIRIQFAIISRKEPTRASRNLPLFSRISLRRSLKSLTVMSTQGQFGYIRDTRAVKPGRKKPKKA